MRRKDIGVLVALMLIGTVLLYLSNRTIVDEGCILSHDGLFMRAFEGGLFGVRNGCRISGSVVSNGPVDFYIMDGDNYSNFEKAYPFRCLHAAIATFQSDFELTIPYDAKWCFVVCNPYVGVKFARMKVRLHSPFGTVLAFVFPILIGTVFYRRILKEKAITKIGKTRNRPLKNNKASRNRRSKDPSPLPH